MPLTEYRQFAQEMARQAGEIMRRSFTLGMEKEWKQDQTPVTKADTEINELLLARVRDQFPTHNVRGEEASALGQEGEFCWVCDPVDGTIPFSHGIPIATFSLALTRDGVSILGVIYDPFGDRLFVGEQGAGSTLNGQPIRVSAQAEFPGSVGNIEAHHTHPYRVHTLTEYLSDQARVTTLRFASSIYPAALVAAGELAFTIMPNDTAHDAAAVKILVEEAGGKVTDLFGQDQRYDRPINGIIASNGMLHDQLVELAKRYITKR